MDDDIIEEVDQEDKHPFVERREHLHSWFKMLQGVFIWRCIHEEIKDLKWNNGFLQRWKESFYQIYITNILLAIIWGFSTLNK